MRITAILTLAAALALSACGSRPDDAEPAANNMIEVPEEMIPANDTPPEVEVPNNSAPAAPPPAVSEEQQTLDDADATGLTARLPEDDSAMPTNQARPAE